MAKELIIDSFAGGGGMRDPMNVFHGDTPESIKNHSGSKYIRNISSCHRESSVIEIDVYAVLVAFDVTCPARQHAIKKLLCAGIRGKNNESQDLKEAVDALRRAIEMQENVEARKRLSNVKT